MKVYYFPLHARGECIRMLLTHAKQPFEDVRVQMQDWPKIKNDTSMFEFGQMPMLELENGQRITQTKAIVRSLGQRFGYYSSNPKEAWLIDSTIDFVSDEMGKFAGLLFASPDKKTEMLFELLTKQLPAILAIIEKRVTGKRFIVGDRITIADFVLGSLLFSTVANENHPNFYAFQHILKTYPATSDYIENFRNEMKEYLAKRGPAPF